MISVKYAKVSQPKKGSSAELSPWQSDELQEMVWREEDLEVSKGGWRGSSDHDRDWDEGEILGCLVWQFWGKKLAPSV